VNFNSTDGNTASPDDLAALQQRLSERLPFAYLAFVASHDGALPEPNVLKVGDDAFGVHHFIAVKQIPHQMTLFKELPANAFPVAGDDCGNYFVMDLAAAGAVFLWNHELPEPMMRLADSFDAFLEALVSFDESSIRLQSDQVLDVWVDPTFRKGLQG